MVVKVRVGQSAERLVFGVESDRWVGMLCFLRYEIGHRIRKKRGT